MLQMYEKILLKWNFYYLCKMNLDFEIDILTHSIENAVSGESFLTEVMPLSKSDLLQITKKNRWQFNWKNEYGKQDREVFKLIIINNPMIIQGLISLEVKSGFIEIPLIESAPFNFRHNKMYNGVSGNLVAFACKLSFECGFDGYIGFVAKTKLIAHYEAKLGAKHVGNQRMIIEKPQAEFLVKKYFNDFKIN